MEALESEMKGLRKRFENQENELGRLLNLTSVDTDAVEAYFNMLLDLNGEIRACSNKLLEQMRSDAKPEVEIDAENEKIDKFAYRFEFMRLKVKKILKTDEEKTDSLRSGSVSGESKRKFKLPNVEIRKFDGTRTEWLGFWAQFERIHEDPDLCDSDKFWYLLDSLKPGSEALELASLYPQSAQNYPKVIEALRRKYGNESMLLQVYIRELLSLVIANVSSKEKLPFQTLFMKVDSHLRALRSLQLKNADPETWLFPLVESSLPERVLYNWQHSPLSSLNESSGEDDPPKSRLDCLLQFMGKEVEIQQNIEFARKFSQETSKIANSKASNKKDSGDTFSKKPVATVASFHASDKPSCAFCKMTNHKSSNCRRAKNMKVEDLRNCLRKMGLCFKCFEPYHAAAECKSDVKCEHCGYRHHSVMCPKKNDKRKNNSNDGKDLSFEPSQKKQKTSEPSSSKSHVNVSHITSAVVYSQTLIVKVCNGNRSLQVRVFLDTGSKRSYITKRLAKELNLTPHSIEKITHTLFGGIETGPTLHKRYNLKIESISGKFSCNLTVRDKDVICHPLERLALSNEMKQLLNSHKIELTDVGPGSPPIDILIGSDFYGSIIAEGIRNLNNGLVAINTKLGWTIVGEKKEALPSKSFVSLCMSVHDKELPHLWDLEVLGIRDSTEVLKGKELEEKVQQDFLKKVTRKPDGRYLISLPWKEDHPILPTNKEVAIKRLECTTKKLVQSKLFDAYDSLFKEWLREGFIEKVNDDGKGINVHYLPHRAVIKDSLTTPVRPVFDASCKKGKNPSLNQCLHKGCNLILQIPDILLRFRENAIGFTSDIRKAFQMIEVEESDRDCFRFLWWKTNEMAEMDTFRHVRVPFGATCSPFILGAIIKLHLENVKDDDKEIANKLINNFYVDNCLCSVSTLTEYENFKFAAVRIFNETQMDLRMWLTNCDPTFPNETKTVSGLGLQWDRENDTLSIDSSKLNQPEKLTKRTVLSLLQRIFDPIGFTCPITLPIKILLQKTWIDKVKWDSELPEKDSATFIRWCLELKYLAEVKIPRLFTFSVKNNLCIHVFNDASKDAYATAVFLRSENDGQVKIQLLGAKSRVAPPKKITIPRLELLASLIGATLYSNIINALNYEDMPVYFWCDSTTVLAWIRRNDQWGTFVGNRIKKILNFSRVEDWRYVPSALNAADLPSRGCSPEELLKSKWWQGPSWLYLPEMDWPVCEETHNENEITAETVLNTTCVAVSYSADYNHDFSFKRRIKIVGWMSRFIYNCKNPKEKNLSPSLSDVEFKKAEVNLLKLIQLEGLDEKNQDGILRVKTRITQRDDLADFKYPAILPGKHPLVRRLVSDLHIQHAHAGVGIMLSILREKYWLLKARRTVQNILCKCFRCRRFSAKPTITETAALPLNRVKDAEPFEVTGLDLAGPLFLKNGKKVWMVVFTCAIYRAVHLRLVNSLSTKVFINCLQEFITRFRRPAVIYSDNGTNFRGSDRLFASLNWEEIKNNTGLARIDWIFNPSTASWWGGFWERLIRSAKDLIRRTLGKSKLNKKELEAVLWTVEQALNNRPLTYVSENPEDLEPLTPNLFLHPFGSVEFPEKEMTEADKLRFRLKFVQTMRKELKDRWRNEYLALLVGRGQKATRKLKVGELVVVSSDNRKRVEWPLARIMELIPSQSDGICRVARVKTEDGILTRPVQRLHPLEADADEEETKKMKETVTKSRRVVRAPNRYE